MGQSCCSQQKMSVHHVIAADEPKPEGKLADGVLVDLSAQSLGSDAPPLAAAAITQSGWGAGASPSSALPGGVTLRFSGVAPIGGLALAASRQDCYGPGDEPFRGRTVDVLAAPSAQQVSTPALRRQISLTVCPDKPPDPPPPANKDLNGSAVSALRQPNRKRSLRASSSRPASMDVCTTTLNKNAASTATLWAALPVVASKDSVRAPPASTRSSSHKERYGAAGRAEASFSPRQSFNEGDIDHRSVSHNVSTSTNRDRWDDSSLLEEARG